MVVRAERQRGPVGPVDDDKTFLRNAKPLIGRHAPLLTVETADGSMDALLKIGIFVIRARMT